MSTAKMNIWGDPSTMNKMADTFFQGQQIGFLTDGIVQNTPDSVKNALAAIGQELLSTHPPASNGDNANPPSNPGKSDKTAGD
jgi:hypothetical protein